MQIKEILNIHSRIKRLAVTAYINYDNQRQLAKLFSNKGKTPEQIEAETETWMEIKGALSTVEGHNPFFHRDGTPRTFTRTP